MPLSQILDISEVAEQSGFAPSALRYYEDAGLIESCGRRGLRRQFVSSVLERLAFITLGRQAGFSLEEIGAMFAEDGHVRIDRDQLLAKADALDKHIQRLVAARDGLRHAAMCPADNHLNCDKFQRLLRIAQKRRRRPSENTPRN
ncbi:MAG TPA: MerR family transcriptional regulator [Gammaproteobacteria bacterium]|jgi:DNA-binding transcriptional MerR regulator|nr:MerR family transcriptional regulator [Gammaproteobacteria bacterium]